LIIKVIGSNPNSSLNSSFFYRATFIVNAVVAAARCLSVVRLTRWCFASIWLKIPSNFFVDPVAHHSCFLNPSAGAQFRGEHFQWRRKIMGMGKFCDFRLKSPTISETLRDSPMVAMKR